jgi:hypothetical protein
MVTTLKAASKVLNNCYNTPMAMGPIAIGLSRHIHGRSLVSLSTSIGSGPSSVTETFDLGSDAKFNKRI